MKRVRGASRGVLLLLLGVAGVLTMGIGAQRHLSLTASRDWPQFGYDPASSGASPAWTGITAANTASLTRRQVTLDGTVDASAIYLHEAVVNGANHDVFFVTTTYGKTIAIDARAGTVLWEYTPTSYASYAGTAQVTNSTPAADPDRQHIYAAAPDGTVQKLAIANGSVVWSTSITMLPGREKIASPLKFFNGHVIAVTGGYNGDAPPYQGHVAILDAQTGTLLSVWNSLCSNRSGLIQPSSCSATRSAIWGRAGAVIDPATGNIFVATGNGPYDGGTNWGDALIELDPLATSMLANYTPTNNSTLNNQDLDLGSSSPVLLAPGVVAQGGKDSMIHVVSLAAIGGTTPHAGGELQNVSTPSKALLFTAPAVWQSQGQTWMFAADGGATTAWTFANGTLTQMWTHPTGGTSPIVAGGLLYVYNTGGGLHVYDPQTGASVATLTSGSGHWNSPIAIDGRIALPEGNANQHATTGVLDIWTAAAEGRQVIPGEGNGAAQIFMATFTDPLGWDHLDVVNMLVNDFLDGRNACYLAYSRPLNTLYLVNDNGTGLLTGLTLNGSGSIANSQCTVNGSGSSASGSGDELTLNVNLTFTSNFAGRRIVYLAARDITQTNSGWNAKGTWAVPGASATNPGVAALMPARGETSNQTFTLTFTDTKGYQDIGVVNLLINDFLDGRHACYLAYSRPLNTLYLVNDAGTALLTGMAMNGSGTLGNSQCVVDGSASSVSATGNTVTLTLALSFSTTFFGDRVMYMAARDTAEANNSGWQAMGSWTIG